LFEERDDLRDVPREGPRGDGGGGVISLTSDKNTDEVSPPEGSPSFRSKSGKQDNKFNIEIEKNLHKELTFMMFIRT